jgi:hypothetical protein
MPSSLVSPLDFLSLKTARQHPGSYESRLPVAARITRCSRLFYGRLEKPVELVHSLEALNLQRGDRILDVGCGTGVNFSTLFDSRRPGRPYFRGRTFRAECSGKPKRGTLRAAGIIFLCTKATPAGRPNFTARVRLPVAVPSDGRARRERGSRSAP